MQETEESKNRDSKGRFKKGQSGNPSGTSKKYKEIKDLAESYSTQALQTLADIMLNVAEGTRYRIQASNSILDRAFGKPTVVQDVSVVVPNDSDAIDLSLIHI